MEWLGLLIGRPQDVARRYGIPLVTLRKWVQRGHLTRHSDGYDLEEVLERLDTRDTRKDRYHRAARSAGTVTT